MSNFLDPVILVIDTDPVALASVLSALDCEPYVVHIAHDLDSAVEISGQCELDLVITEMKVGSACGLDIVEKIRAIPGREDVPVMYASANQNPDVIRRTHDTGAAFHLRKPIDPRVLLELVSKSMWMPHLVNNHIEQNHGVQDRVRAPHMPIPGVEAGSSIVESKANSFS